MYFIVFQTVNYLHFLALSVQLKRSTVEALGPLCLVKNKIFKISKTPEMVCWRIRFLYR